MATVRFIGGLAHRRDEPGSAYAWYGHSDPPPLIKKEVARQVPARHREHGAPPEIRVVGVEHYRLIGVRDGVAVYLYEQTAIELAEEFYAKAERCEVCGGAHASKSDWFGWPVKECPELGPNEMRVRMGSRKASVEYGHFYRVAPLTEEEQQAIREMKPDVLKKAVDDIAKAISKVLSSDPVLAGIMAADVEAARAIVEAPTLPVCDKCRQPSTSLMYGLCPLCESPSYYAAAGVKLDPVHFPTSKNVAPTGDGRLKVEEPGWVCTNHPPGCEITYPATTPACEVCQMPRPALKPERCYQCDEVKIFSGEFCDDCTERNREEPPEQVY